MDGWSVYERLQDEERTELSDDASALMALGDLRQEVNSGGFDAYLRFWGADTAPRALAVCRSTAGLAALADVLEDALSRLGAYSPDADARAEALDSAGVDLDDLDERFSEIEAAVDLDRIMTRFAQNAVPDS